MLSEDLQSMVGILLHVADVLTKMMETFTPAINRLQHYLQSIDDLNLVSNAEFSQVCSLFVCVYVYVHILDKLPGENFFRVCLGQQRRSHLSASQTFTTTLFP